MERRWAGQISRQIKSGFLSVKYDLSPPANPALERDEVKMLNDI